MEWGAALGKPFPWLAGHVLPMEALGFIKGTDLSWCLRKVGWVRRGGGMHVCVGIMPTFNYTRAFITSRGRNLKKRAYSGDTAASWGKGRRGHAGSCWTAPKATTTSRAHHRCSQDPLHLLSSDHTPQTENKDVLSRQNTHFLYFLLTTNRIIEVENNMSKPTLPFKMKISAVEWYWKHGSIFWLFIFNI